MKKTATILACILLMMSGCNQDELTEQQEGYEVIEQTENYTLYAIDRRQKRTKRAFMVRACCEYYSFSAGKVILCATNNGNCKWCEEQICNQVHP